MRRFSISRRKSPSVKMPESTPLASVTVVIPSALLLISKMTSGIFASGATRGICVGYVAPEAAIGGPLALLRDGDIIRIDGTARRMDVLIDAAELAHRRAAWRPSPPRHKAGLLAKYAAQVGQANKGAVTHPGGAEWPWFDR